MSRSHQSGRGREIPDSREYIHRACGGTTVISGRDFTKLASPFEMCTGTYCVACRKMTSLDAVAWADTGEVIAEYRKRLWQAAPKRNVPPLLRVLVPLAGVALGAILGYLFAPIKPRGLTIGAILGGTIAFLVYMPLGNRVNQGIDYRGVR